MAGLGRLSGLIINLNPTATTKLNLNLTPSPNFTCPPQSFHLSHRTSPTGNPTTLTSHARVSLSLSLSLYIYIYAVMYSNLLTLAFPGLRLATGKMRKKKKGKEKRFLVLLFCFFLQISYPSSSILLAVHCLVLTNVIQNLIWFYFLSFSLQEKKTESNDKIG